LTPARAVSRAAALAIALLGGLAGASAFAQDGPIPAGRGIEWGVSAGYGVPVRAPSRPSDESELAFLASAGFRVNRRLEYVAEADGFGFLHPGGYYVGLMPLGGRLSVGNGPLLPFASVGLGFGWTDLVELEEISRRFNFQVQVGIGIRGAVTDTTGWTTELRILHISNAGTVYPNRGLNSLLVLGGFRFR